MENKNLVISFKTILTLAISIFCLYLLVELKAIVMFLFVSIILALGIEPAVEFLTRRKISRGISIVLVFLVMLLVLGFILTFTFTPIVNQTANLASHFPQLIDNIIKIPGVESWVFTISQRVSESLSNLDSVSNTVNSLLKVSLGAFFGLFSLITIGVFTAYMLMDFRKIRDLIVDLFPKSQRDGIRELIKTIEKKLGSWIRGQIILMFAVGIITFLGLSVFRIDYALSLAFVAGILEIVPIFGPILSLIPAAIVAFSISPLKGILVIALYIIVQQIENNILVPKIMQKTVGLNPIVTMLVLLVGGKLFGFAGIVFAVPVSLIAFTLLNYLRKEE